MMLLVIYDVSDDSKRLKLSKRLMQFGLSRIQRSAFIGKASSSLAKDIERASSSIIDKSTDIVHLIKISEMEWNLASKIGKSYFGVEEEWTI
ncbi:MAG: CRISPR-associated endonuclease Cas2 [Caldisphaera sp.]|nr:MAG: CRISPR-associated endonuclease Cas2 [Caldisphaera sp.]